MRGTAHRLHASVVMPSRPRVRTTKLRAVNSSFKHGCARRPFLPLIVSPSSAMMPQCFGTVGSGAGLSQELDAADIFMWYAVVTSCQS